MISVKRANLRPLLESAHGVHLSVYLVNSGDLINLKTQLKDAIQEALAFLRPAMTSEECKKFLEPLESLLDDDRILNRMNANVGIFRTHDFFRVLNLPCNIEPACIVATTFHVKPLLKWLQTDPDYLVLCLEARAARLYLGNQQRLNIVDSLYYEGNSASEITRLNNWLLDLAGKSRPRLFFAGTRELTDPLMKNLKYPNFCREPIYLDFSSGQVDGIAAAIRSKIRAEADEKLEHTLIEFRLAEGMNLAQKNIFQIAKAAAQGRVRKLIIADGIRIYGKIDSISGGLSLHPFDLDHEDDDVLDDLAQMVLLNGGEVFVADRDVIPKGRPAIAILDYRIPARKETNLRDTSNDPERRII